MASLIAHCIKIAGGTNEGVLFYRIGFWDRRNNRSGVADRWAKHTHEGWAEDTGLSQHQIKRAMAELRKRNLIETKQGLFNNRNVTHARLSTRGIALYGQGKIAPTEEGKSALLYVQEETTGETIQEISSNKFSQYASAKKELENKTGEAMLPEVKEDQDVKASDVLAKYHSGKKSNVSSKVSDLAIQFKAGYAQHTGKFAPALTQADMGKLKHFVGKMPSGVKAHEVLEKVLGNWLAFTEAVKQSAGLKTVPQDPSLPFLLTYATIAINFTPADEIETVKTAETFVVKTKDDDIANPLDLL